jgi:hypothetical protein
MGKVKKIGVEEWRKEGERRFGKDLKQWKFVCPACKTVQSPQDLIDAGIVDDDELDSYLAFSCIGRFTEQKKGCDWTLGGLFQFHQTEVIRDDGKARKVFEFAEKES